MSTKELKRAGSSFARSVLAGAGSILDLAGASAGFFEHSKMARQDRDVASIRGDRQRIEGYMRSAVDKIRRESGLSHR